MTRLILLASALALALPTTAALATQPNPPPFQGGTSNASASASAAAAASAKSSAVGIGQGGHAAAVAGGGAGGSVGNISVGAPSLNIGGNTVRTYATIPPGLMAAASGPCVGASRSVSIGIGPAAGGFGESTIERECQVREAARLLGTLGDVETARALIMSLASVREALAPAAATPAAQPVATVAQPAPAPAAVWRNGVMP
jgi:hypothetical protein